MDKIILYNMLCFFSQNIFSFFSGWTFHFRFVLTLSRIAYVTLGMVLDWLSIIISWQEKKENSKSKSQSAKCKVQSAKWHGQDYIIQHYVFFSRNIASLHCLRYMDVWSTLGQIFQTTSKARVLQLRLMLQMTKKCNFSKWRTLQIALVSLDRWSRKTI